MFIHTGDYVEHRNNTPLPSTYYTFTPRPLMDGGFYSMTDELSSLLAETHRRIGILEGVLLSFCDRGTFSDLTMLKESCFNKMIDYPDIDLNSVIHNHGIGNTDDKVSNIVSTYRSVLDTPDRKISYDDIARCAVYGSDSKQKARVRSSQIFLSKSISNYRQYNPTAPKDILSAMNDLDRYASLNEIDVLIKAAMHHYQFEMIHPYENYNGVVGRLIIYKILNDAGLKGVRFLSISKCLYNHKGEYFEKLGLTQKNGYYVAWIEFFINMINEAAQKGINSTQDYIKIIRTDNEKLAGSRDSLRHLVDVYDYFKKNIVSSVNQTCNQLQITFNAASRSIETLKNLGILTQVTAQSRNRLFTHASLLQLFLSE